MKIDGMILTRLQKDNTEPNTSFVSMIRCVVCVRMRVCVQVHLFVTLSALVCFSKYHVHSFENSCCAGTVCTSEVHTFVMLESIKYKARKVKVHKVVANSALRKVYHFQHIYVLCAFRGQR